MEMENEIKKEIINNSLLDSREEDLEEDYDDGDNIEEINISEKNKFINETYDNKISLNENEETKENDIISDNNKQNSITIYKDIIENLLIELFEYHYTELSKEKKVNLRNRILEYKYHIELYCSKLSANFSKYILCVLEKKINELNAYILDMVNKNIARNFKNQTKFKINWKRYK